MSIGFQFRVPARSEILLAFTSHYDVLAKAGKMSMTQAAKIAKEKGRASIRAGGQGFQRRWPNALRADVYPKGKNSANAAALIYIRSTYAGIFEEGGTVRPVNGRFMWLPLADAPKTIGRKKITPERYIREIGPLALVQRPGKLPLLVTFVRGSAKRLAGRVTRRQLSTGGSRTGEVKMVPIFVGIKKASIPRKWGIREAAIAAVAELPNLFIQNLRRARG